MTVAARTIEFLRDERERLLALRETVEAELQEVALLIDVLAAPAKPKKQAGWQDHGGMAVLQRKAMAVLETNGGCTVKFVAEAIGASGSHTRKVLTGLVGEGRVTYEVESRRGMRNGGRGPYVYRLVPTVDVREHHVDMTNGLVVD